MVVDSDGNVWVSEPDSNKIARISESHSDFALTASPSFLSLNQGEFNTFSVTGVSISGYAGPLSLTASGVPPGVSLSNFEPRLLNIPSGGNTTANVMINVTSTASNGISLILIHASNGTLDHTSSIVLVVAASAAESKPQCLIATATFGSQLSPVVGLLRGFRDNDILKTEVGKSFMMIFNAWYYSFSPYIANYIANHEPVRVAMMYLLYPLTAVFYLATEIYSKMSFYPEFAVLVAGLSASSLIGSLYLGLPLGLLSRRRRLRRRWNSRIPAVILFVGLFGIWVGLVSSSLALLMISTPLSVLASMFVSITITADLISLK
jgi:hypothetical protein